MPCRDVTGPEGTADVRLGMGIDELRALLGPADTFHRTPSAPPTDFFVDAGVMATYEPGGAVTFLELVEPAAPLLAGVALLGRSLDGVAVDLAAAGLDVVRHADGATVRGWGIGLYAPVELVEGVSFGA
ncbi:hypothetical protein [Cellulomonas sp.]|uniref:hypothetical protein n=1 Tax=Cellulomonas sp. TaxID=40001 RepID=UPI0028110802|nr:hypothetical protein [Cellulomonas sp.]